MSPSSHVTGTGLVKLFLQLATNALSAGDVAAARQFALALLNHGSKNSNANAQAQAFLLLSQADILTSQMQRARSLSDRALTLFEQDDNADGQAQALAVASYSASSLGAGDDALEAATRAVVLREARDSPVVQAFGYNYLGVAAFWAGDFDAASDTLEAAVWFARDASEDQSQSFQPLVNSCFLEVLRLLGTDAENHHGDLGRLTRLVDSSQALSRRGNAGLLNPAVTPVGLLLLSFTDCFAKARASNQGAAHLAYNECRDRAATLPGTSWLHSVVEWAKFEVAKAAGDIEQAAAAARRMHSLALTGQHQPMAGIAAKLASDALASLEAS